MDRPNPAPAQPAPAQPAPAHPRSASTADPVPAPYALRPATNADAPAARQLVFAVLAEFGLTPDPACTDADLADIEASYCARGGRFDVVTDPAGRIVGTVGLYPTGDGTVELRKMYLLPAARGRGLGRALLLHALAQARRAGFRRMTLETASVLKDAIALYERHGFTPYTPEHMAGRCDQAYELKLD